jgi:hypothetical protein
MRAEDALKYAAALLTETGWACEAIFSAECGGHEELEAISSVVGKVERLAEQFGDPRRYSDGRMVKSRAEIERGTYTEHVWHPDPTCAKPTSWRGQLLSDPGVPSPGIYEVSTDPVTQDIHVRVVRTA